jgi:transposase
VKTELTAKEIAYFLGIKKQAVLLKSKNGNWPYSEVQNPRGGGFQRKFQFNGLPLDVQIKIIAAKINCDPDLLPPENLNENRCKDLLNKWKSTSEGNRQRAYARHRIVEAVQDFCLSNGYKQTYGEKIFIVLYRDHKAPGIDEKVYNQENSFSEATIRRWRKAYRKDGIFGLLTSYKTQAGKSRAITPEIQVFLIKNIAQTPHIKPAHLFRLVQKEFTDFPSIKTIYRFINKWKSENPQIFSLLENPNHWKNNYMPAFGDASAGVDYFGHTWEMDSTPADVITKDGKRCTLIGAIDVFSRRTVVVVAPTSKSTAISLCMRKALLQWGIPERIKKDNGKDYQSAHITAITTALEIETPLLAKYAGEEKPYIERFFGTMASGLEELLPGFCGHSVADRQAIRSRKTWASKIMTPGVTVEVPLTMKELQEVIGKWIKDVYEHAPHKGINDKSPYEKFKKSRFFPSKIRDKRILDVLLAPVSNPRVIRKKGIAIDGVFYHAPELISYIGTRVIARRDFENAGLIYVFRATTDEYICKATNEALQGENLEEYMAAKKRHEKDIKQAVNALKKLGRGSKTAVQILLEDNIEHPLENVVPFQTEADTPAIQEAQKAVNDTECFEAPQKSQTKPYTPKAIDPLDSSWMTKEDWDYAGEEALEFFEERKKKISI